MQIVEQRISSGDHEIFELEEFLSRPLYAHLAHSSDQGARESPVWFHWDGQAIWIVGGTSFPANLRRDPRCALGIVDWDPATGLIHHVGIRGRAEVRPFDCAMARTIFRRYFGPDKNKWDGRFGEVFSGDLGLEMIRITPETVVMRDQTYRPTPFMSRLESRQQCREEDKAYYDDVRKQAAEDHKLKVARLLEIANLTNSHLSGRLPGESASSPNSPKLKQGAPQTYYAVDVESGHKASEHPKLAKKAQTAVPLELAILKVVDGKVVDRLTKKFAQKAGEVLLPRRKNGELISPHLQDLVAGKGGESKEEITAAVKAFVPAGSTMVGANSKAFDIPILSRTLGLTIGGEILDVLEIARNQLGMPSKSTLADVSKKLGISGEGAAHEATGGAQNASDVLQEMAKQGKVWHTAVPVAPPSTGPAVRRSTMTKGLPQIYFALDIETGHKSGAPPKAAKDAETAVPLEVALVKYVDGKVVDKLVVKLAQEANKVVLPKWTETHHRGAFISPHLQDLVAGQGGESPAAAKAMIREFLAAAPGAPIVGANVRKFVLPLFTKVLGHPISHNIIDIVEITKDSTRFCGKGTLAKVSQYFGIIGEGFSHDAEGGARNVVEVAHKLADLGLIWHDAPVSVCAAVSSKISTSPSLEAMEVDVYDPQVGVADSLDDGPDGRLCGREYEEHDRLDYDDHDIDRGDNYG